MSSLIDHSFLMSNFVYRFTPSALRTVHSSTIPLVVCQVLPERGRLTRVVFNKTAQKTVGMYSMAMIDLIYAFLIDSR